ncbi:hypothetical protein ZIOFF_060944 [Zingiber officinale]|uniref:Arf-GAP domain-containing protein n=1 Tax=Zingiber officinale TaxID=94328 RepID=A0A8J5FPY9_ZINOF|nr:hypothetical protein ZIOFF_060944 [Zingiber officinale]
MFLGFRQPARWRWLLRLARLLAPEATKAVGNVREQDRSLPIANIIQIMKSLPMPSSSHGCPIPNPSPVFLLFSPFPRCPPSPSPRSLPFDLSARPMGNRYYRSENPASGAMRKLKELMLKGDNHICADCSASDPKWSPLGTDVSKVLPLTLEEWTESDIDSMIEVGGNSYANSIYEAFLPKGHRKPKPDSSPSMSCKIS